MIRSTTFHVFKKNFKNPEPSGAHKSAHQPQPTVVKSRTLFCLHIFFKEISKFCLVNNEWMNEPFIMFYTLGPTVLITDDHVRDIFLINASFTLLTFLILPNTNPPPSPPVPRVSRSSPSFRLIDVPSIP